MSQINAKKIGLASTITGAIGYISCILIMSLLGKEALIYISNMLLHGADVTNIIRMDIPITEAIMGMVLFSIICGLFAYVLALIYNKL